MKVFLISGNIILAGEVFKTFYEFLIRSTEVSS